ncbi:unnamed protein product [marine sediment metagenome]|uniref:Uncharacterized protein n=1 Tax=marine sediment metagenome TaxID=412755 RepID=X1MFR2_9ZZZZ
MMDKCIHHWLCENGANGKVPAACLKCGAQTVFEPKFIDGRSALDFGSNWVDMRLRTHGGWSGDLDNAVKVLEG